MRTIALVTVGRSDWGIYRPIVRLLAAAPDVRLRVLVSGMHLSMEFGSTANVVESELGPGVEVEQIDMLLSSDAPQAVAKSMGMGLASFAQSFAHNRPDILLVLGDRFEMFAAVAAAVPFIIPVAHVHGGERTAGAIDDALRHAMTKLSHLHFVSTAEYGRRVRQLGEDAWRVVVSGAPAIDELLRLVPRDGERVSSEAGFDVERVCVLVSFHPTTLERGAALAQGRTLIEALEHVGLPTLFMMPNADPGGRVLRNLVRERCATNHEWHAVENLSFETYVEVLRRTAVLGGNSSSGISEAPPLGIPVVNVGARQEGRVRAKNVVDVQCDVTAIANAIGAACGGGFRERLSFVNPYGNGGAASAIVGFLQTVPLDRLLVRKGFIDIPTPTRRRNPADFTVHYDASLFDVAACIDRNRAGVAIVVDSNGCLLDTITDGDIRRALLGGATLDLRAAALSTRRTSSYPNPVYGEAGLGDEAYALIMRKARVRQLPVLLDGVVVDLICSDDFALEEARND